MRPENQILRVPITAFWQHPGGSTGTVTGAADLHGISIGSDGIRKGDHVRPLPWGYSVRRFHGPQGEMSLTSGSTVIRQTGLLGNGWYANAPAIPGTLYNDLLDRLNEKVRGGIDLSIDAFQAQQTKRMFSAAGRVEDLARAARQRGRGVAKLVGSAWLELQYGWRPLIATIHDAGEKLAFHTVEKRLRFKARISKPVGNYKPDKARIGCSIYTIDADRRFDVKGVAGMEMAIQLKASNSSMASIAGWTSMNPVSIAWELVPYSFVVDWFFDLGGYMRNLETSLIYGALFDYGYVSTLRAVDVNYTISYANAGGSGFAQGRSSTRVFSRAPMSSYPLPRFPSFRCDLGSGRLLNAAALLSQHLK